MTDTDRTARMRVLHTPLRPVPGSSRARAPITCKPLDVPVRPVIRKTGPSAATLTLGVFMLLVGAVAILFGVRFPNGVLAWFDMDPRVMFAIGCAVVGGALILIAIIWSLAKIARNARTPHDE